jgi:hypothetical protein
MFDERWSSDVADVASTLRSLLEDRCSEAVVRATEATESGWSPEVEAHLREFGLYELPAEADLLAAIAIELGRVLAPVPWPEVAAVFAVLGVSEAACALDSPPPLGPPNAIVRVGAGAGLVSVAGSNSRTGAGDVLVRLEPHDVAATYDGRQTADLAAMMRLLGAGRIVGASTRLLEIGVDYAKERHAFGRPIGTYQGVSHKLADAAIAVEGAELLIKKAAYLARQEGEGSGPSPLFAAMVWSNAVDAGRMVARSVHQCMGGFGATLEYPAQLYSRRIRSWSLRLGRHGDAYRTIGRQVLDREQRDAIVGLWHEERGISIPRWAREIDLVPRRSA